MAGEIQSPVHIDYVIIRDTIGRVWNGTAFEAILAANWGTYDIATPQVTGINLWQADFPSPIPAGVYSVLGYRQIGGSPSPTADILVAHEIYPWTGAAREPVQTADVADVLAANVAVAGIVFFGTVAASPTPTTTTFTVTLSTTLSGPFTGVAADLIGQQVTFLSGARASNAVAIVAATVNSSTSLALTVDDLPAAPVAADRVLISE